MFHTSILYSYRECNNIFYILWRYRCTLFFRLNHYAFIRPVWWFSRRRRPVSVAYMTHYRPSIICAIIIIIGIYTYTYKFVCRERNKRLCCCGQCDDQPRTNNQWPALNSKMTGHFHFRAYRNACIICEWNDNNNNNNIRDDNLNSNSNSNNNIGIMRFAYHHCHRDVHFILKTPFDASMHTY